MEHTIILNRSQVREIIEKQQYLEDSLYSALDSITQSLKEKISGKDKESFYKNNEGIEYYTFIPYSSHTVAECLMTIRDRIPEEETCKIKYFLDVGCGIGNIMAIAHGFDYKAFGIEYSKAVLKYALYNYHPIGKTSPTEGYKRTPYIYEGDAFDFPYYDQFDVIYFYHPIKDSTFQRKLEEKIFSSMKPGSYVICVSPHLIPTDLTYICDHIFQKKGEKNENPTLP